MLEGLSQLVQFNYIYYVKHIFIDNILKFTVALINKILKSKWILWNNYFCRNDFSLYYVRYLDGQFQSQRFNN